MAWRNSSILSASTLKGVEGSYIDIASSKQRERRQNGWVELATTNVADAHILIACGLSVSKMNASAADKHIVNTPRK